MSEIVNPWPQASGVPYAGYAQQPSKPHGWIWVVVVILLLSLLVSTVQLAARVGLALRPFARPVIVADQYYTAIKNRDYAQAYTYLDSSLTSSLTQDQFIKMAQQRDVADGTVSSYSIAPDFTGNPAENVNVTVMRSKGTSYIVQLHIRQVGKEWKISAFDRI
jgi:hypothetical protein